MTFWISCYLNEPITAKTTERGGSKEANGIRWGVSSMQGWRNTMEDGHIVEEITTVEDPETGESIDVKEPHYLFAVMDGHAGPMVAEYASKHLYHVLKRRPEFVTYAKSVDKVTNDVNSLPTDDQQPGDSSPTTSIPTSPDGQQLTSETNNAATLLQRALEDSFIELDLQLLKEVVHKGLYQLPPDPDAPQSMEAESTGDGNKANALEPDQDEEESSDSKQAPKQEGLRTGTTVTTLLVTPDLMICANVGDSRTIIDGVALSTDHKPTLPEEKLRILMANGTVKGDRVDGDLTVSRALGDFDLKEYNQSLVAEGNMDMDKLRALACKVKVSPFPEALSDCLG